MNLAPSAVEEEIAAATRRWLSRELPPSRSRVLAEQDGPLPDETTWRRCAELGWLGLGAPASCGGLEFGAAGEVMLFRELGRQAAPGPFLASVLGVHVAAWAGAVELAQTIVAGERRVAAAVGDRVLDGRPGDLLLRVDDDGATLAELHRTRPGGDPLDPLMRTARVADETPVLRADNPLVLARAHVLAAAQLLGVVEAVRDMSVEYAKTRTQFGQPIGAFQAVKHRCAQMEVAAYGTVGQVHHAALAVDACRDGAAFQAASAYLVAARAATRSATDNIQNHGGIGFTWEHDAHLYLKRATVLSNLFGPLRRAHDQIMAPLRHEFG